MAKVYSWEINRAKKRYGYIIHPSSINDENPDVYIGDELKGENLEKIIEWTSNCTTEQYINQFEKLKSECTRQGYDVEFENVDAYLYVKGTCDELRGPAGRGIKSIREINRDPVTNITTLAVYYDDDTFDTFELQGGTNGLNGKDGRDGANGFDGVSSKTIIVYKSYQENELPERPEGGSYDFTINKLNGEDELNEQGWYRSDSNLNGIVYMSSRTFASTEASTDNEWSIPVRITGDKGEAGKDGTSIEFIYNLTQNEPEVINLISENKPGYVPSIDGWTASPSGVDENNTKEWCSIRNFDNEKNEWGPWQKATIWSNYGVNGQDGDGVQYIYYKTNTSTPPDNPTPNNYEENDEYQDPNSEWIPQSNYSYTNIDSKFVSFDNDWTDNPTDVTINEQYAWVCSRKYRKINGKKSWGTYSKPSLWAKFGVDGENATSIKKIYALSTSTDTSPVLNKSDITGGSLWSTGFPKGYKKGENVVWCSEAEISAKTNNFIGSYKIVSTRNENGEVIAPEDLNEGGYEIVTSLPNEREFSVKYLVFYSDYYEWFEGYCDPYIVTGIKGDNGEPNNYTTYVFAYGYKEYIPNAPEINVNPNEPGTSNDDMGNTIEWLDFPNTSDGKIDNETRRWYQCCGQVDGKNKIVTQWSTPTPLNAKDGTVGKYTEFRFGLTTNGIKPAISQHDSNNNIMRNPTISSGGIGWYVDIKKLGDDTNEVIKNGGAIWEIYAIINAETDKVEGEWQGPVRISGEKGDKGDKGDIGPAGVHGIPGVSQNQMYCLGTDVQYFGIYPDNINGILPKELYNNYRWLYSDNIPVDLNIIETEGFYKSEDYLGRVLKNKNQGGQYYLVCLSNGVIDYHVLGSDTIDNLYIWCIQGKTVYSNTPDENGEYEATGVTWSKPFKLQGVNGLPGKDGAKGQITYPMGVYNPNEVYTTTDKKAPYVYDPSGEGGYYVLNKQMSWVGELPSNYQYITDWKKNNAVAFWGTWAGYNIDKFAKYGPTVKEIKDDPDYKEGTKYVYRIGYGTKDSNCLGYSDWKISDDGNSVERVSPFIYSPTDTWGDWITPKGSGITPSIDYATNSAYGTNYWEKFDSFNALYASVGIIENGLIGSAVYNGDYMFSQQGKIKEEGNGYEDFDPSNPMGTDNEFIPNICLNFKTGDMWACGGNVSFDNNKITLTADNTIINGNLNIKGLVLKNKLLINNNNYLDYTILDNKYRYLNLKKTGGYIKIVGEFNKDSNGWLQLPSCKGGLAGDATNVNNDTMDDIRSYLGNTIIIVNDTNNVISICGAYQLKKYIIYPSVDEMLEGVPIKVETDDIILQGCYGGFMNNQICYATCCSETDDYGGEIVYWELKFVLKKV